MAALATGAVALASGMVLVVATPAYAAVVPVGEGSYTTDRPAGTKGPSNSGGAAVTPKVTSRVSGPVPTNDWWSSLIWPRYAGNPYSENLYAHPLAFHTYADGLGMSYPDAPAITPDGRTYEHTYSEDLRVGVAGLNSPETKVDGWSDWTVSPYWSDGTRTLRATIGHGSPYAYFTGSGGNARVTFAGTPNVFSNSGGVLGVTVRGHHYALFAPSGATWSLNGTVATSGLAGRDYFSVASLPSTGALALFAKYAYSFVTDTRASWDYDPGSARVTSTFTATTTAKEGTQTGTLLALYRHQWRASSDPVTSHRYASPRGEMRLREGASFTTRATFNGVLPSLPDLGSYDRSRLGSYVDVVLAEPDLMKGATDTYWTGKALGRLAMLVPIADQLGKTTARDRLLDAIRGRLADWLTASPGEAERLFAYDATWDTMIGYPASYGADTELNDHHFHYGYFVLAAAILAKYDPGWVSSGRYGGMVELLVKDSANWSRGDTRFPFLRHFDPYAGHSWASGHAGFAHGNNQESSSEAMMFATAAVLFGEATGNTAMRDTGIYLYTTERAAVGEYWFDASNAVFPATYGHDTLGILWGAGGAYATWWTANPEEIHGINALPVTGGSLYHGSWTADVKANVAEMRSNNGGPETEWRDVIWQFLAIGDPAGAKSAWDGSGGGYEPEWGETKAHTYHWIYNLAATGTPDHTVTADVPTYAVFNRSGTRTYVAHNASGTARTVTFSDGTTLSVPARSTATRVGSGGGDPDPPGGSDTLYLRDGGAAGVTAPLSATAGGSATTDTIPSADGANHDGTPYRPVTYLASNLTMTHDPGRTTAFRLYVDAGTTVANGQQARISYDLTGDGSWDRVETYRYFATNPVAGWELYSQSAGLRSASGALGNLSNGRVKLEVWSAIGNAPTTLRVDASATQGTQSTVVIPFN
ncbi:MAG: glycosyl hydrolase [Micromonosporaceae bacterium]